MSGSGTLTPKEMHEQTQKKLNEFYKANIERWISFSKDELEVDEEKFKSTIKDYEEEHIKYFDKYFDDHQTKKDKYAAIVANTYLRRTDQRISKHLNTLANSTYFTKEYLEKKIQLDDKNHPCTLAELAAKTNNYSTLIKLQNLGVNLDSIKEIVGENTVGQCLEKLKVKQDAQHFYKDNLDKSNEITFTTTGDNCRNEINKWDNLVKHLDEKEQEKYTNILQNTFWKYAEDVSRSDHLAPLLASPYFKISQAKKDNKPLLHAAIDYANRNNNFTPLYALLDRNEIKNTINTSTFDGLLPADRAISNLNTFQVLVNNYGAKNNCDYKQIKDIPDGHLSLIFQSHQDLSRVAEQALKDSNYDFLKKLHNHSFAKNLSIWKTINLENEIYYRDHLSKKIRTDLSNKKEDFKKLITDYDQKFDSLDEEKKSHYRAILLNTFVHCSYEDRDPSDHLTTLLASPYTKEFLPYAKVLNRPLLYAAIDNCGSIKDDTALRALLETKEINSQINTPALYGLLPADRAILMNLEKNALQLLVDEHKAQNNCTYDQLKNIIKDITDAEHLKLIFKSHQNIEKLVEQAVSKSDYHFLLKLQTYDAKLVEKYNLSAIQEQENTNHAQQFYTQNMIQNKNSQEIYTTFTPTEIKGLADEIKTYDQHFKYFNKKQQENYVALLANTYKKIFTDPSLLSRDNLEILTQASNFTPGTILTTDNTKTPLLHTIVHACYSTTVLDKLEALDLLLKHKDIKAAINQPNNEGQLPADIIIYSLELLKKLADKGAKNTTNYETLKQIQMEPSSARQKERLRLILNTHQDINAVDEKTGFTLAESAMLDRNYELLVELNNEGANIERALALGGPNAIDELLKLGPSSSKKTTIENDTSLREKLKHYQKNRTELRVDFCDIVSTIISSKNTEALEKIATQDKFKEKLLAFIRELPEDTQDYIFALSRKEGTDATAFNKIWKKARGSFFTHALGFSEKQPTKETGVYKEILEEAKKRGKKEVFSLSSAELQQKERIDKLKKDIATQKAKLQKTSATNPDLEQKIECNEEEKINSRKLSDVEKVISNGKTQQIIDQFNKTRENKENWGYTFAIAGKKHLEAFKKNVPDTLGTVDLTLLLEDALTNEKENFKKLVDDIQNKKVSPDMLKEIISLYPDFPSRVLSSLKDYYTPKQEYQLLVDALTQPKKSPFAPIWPGNSAQGEQRKARDRMKELKKQIDLEKKEVPCNPFNSQQKLIEKFTKLQKKYDEHADEKADSGRLKAKVKVCSDCLNFLKTGKPLDFGNITDWEASYKKDNIHNVFKQGKGKGFITLENDLAEAVRELFSYNESYGCYTNRNINEVAGNSKTPSAPLESESPVRTTPRTEDETGTVPLPLSEPLNYINTAKQTITVYPNIVSQNSRQTEIKETKFDTSYPLITQDSIAPRTEINNSDSISTTSTIMDLLGSTAPQNSHASSASMSTPSSSSIISPSEISKLVSTQITFADSLPLIGSSISKSLSDSDIQEPDALPVQNKEGELNLNVFPTVPKIKKVVIFN